MQRSFAALLAALSALVPVTGEAGPAAAQGDVDVVIEGKGWGHGVGMPQDGAYSMGAAGASAEDILAAFYPGTSLGQRGGSVRVDLLDRPLSSVTVSLPGGGEVAGSGETSGFPVAVEPGGSVALSFDGNQYRAIPLAGASAAPPSEPEELAAPAAPPAATASVTTTTAPSLLGLIPLPTPTSTAPPAVPAPAPPANEPAGAGEPEEPTSTGPLTVIPADGPVAIDDTGRRYRGTIDAVAGGGGLQLVNELDVEEYLLGMGEVLEPDWPAAALQAQAIAARTYAVDAMTAGRGLCSSQQCQVYVGETAEYAAMNRAVAETSGQVLTFDGRLAEAVYSANGGGISATPEEGFGPGSPEVPYLTSAPYQTVDPMPWDLRMSLGEMAGRLGYGGQPSDIKVSRAGPSGRALEVTVTGDAPPLSVEGRRFAELFQLRSTLFTMRLEKQGAPTVSRSRVTPRRAGRPAKVLSYGDDGTGFSRTPWVALAVALVLAAGTSAGAVRVRQGGRSPTG